MNDEEIAMLAQISEKVPGAVRVAMELRYDEDAPDVWGKLLKVGITGVELWLLYEDCGRDSHAVLVSLRGGTAMEKLRMNPKSRFYIAPAKDEENKGEQRKTRGLATDR